MEKFIVWDTQDLHKVLQKKEYARTPISRLTVKAFQNEVEGTRCLLTPSVDVQCLEVCVSDLQTATGEVLPSTAVEVGFLLYYPVHTLSAGSSHELGEYPDAILPMATAKEQGLNAIRAGENQELYFQIHTQDIAAGEYHGNVEIVADGEGITLPLAVTVWEFALPRKNHSRQFFILDKEQIEYAEGEGDNNYARYYEDMLSYRINPSQLPYTSGASFEESVENYIAQLREKFVDERISVIELLVLYNADFSDIDYEKTGRVVDRIIQTSVKDNVNYFTKLVAYIWIMDEPNLTKRAEEIAKKVLPAFQAFRERYADKCRQRASQGNIWEQVATTILHFPNILTSSVYPPVLSKDTRDFEVTWCSTFVATEEANAIWRAHNKGERWWYGCDWPVPPYPTYHIDDKLVSSRLLSWMQYAADVTGNLYWRVNYWSKRKEGKFAPNDPYQSSAYASTHGEGVLIYPPKRFALPSFLPSLRLCSIRDGIEDFEALYALEKLFQAHGKEHVGVNTLLQPVYSRMFHKAVLLKEPLFTVDRAREIVAECLIAANTYAFFPTQMQEGVLEFSVDCKSVRCVHGTLEKLANGYKVTADKEYVELYLAGKKGEKKLTLYLKEHKTPLKYSFTVNWAETEKKYSVKTDVEGLLRPYYAVLKDDSVGNYNPCTYDLWTLIRFVWKTEAVIVPKATGEVEIYLPYGEFSCQESYTKEPLDESGYKITVTPTGNRIHLQVNNDKGNYPLQLWL